MTISAAGHVRINNRDYLIRRGTYQVFESQRSQPRFGGATDKEFLQGNNWSYWGQSDFIGDGEDDWIGDGPFQTGYGIDISAVDGQVKVAKALTLTRSVASNGGFIAFTAGTTRMWFVDKTTGTGEHTTDGSSWASVANCLNSGVTPTSWVEYKGTYYVGGSNGKIYSNTGGATFTELNPAISATPVYLLGVYKGLIWASWNNLLYTWDAAAAGTTWTLKFPSGAAALGFTGQATIAKVANALLYFMTQGPQSILYMTDGTQLHQLYSFGSDYLPKAMTFAESLMVWGGNTDDTNAKGSVHRLDKNGFFQIYEHGDDTGFYTIQSAIEYGGKVIWGANLGQTGLGVYDPALDLFVDSQMGFYKSSMSGELGYVSGIAQFNNILFCGITNSTNRGIYKQTTPGTYSINSCMFDGNVKNYNKTWGFAEIKHSALISGQTVVLKTSKDGTTFSTWTPATQSVGDVASTYTAPSSPYKSPYLQYQVSGTANGSDLYLFDVSLAYIETPDNPKREWFMLLELEGGEETTQEMLDGTLNPYTSTQMLTQLNSLWNTITTFDDLDGTQYNVVFKAPSAKVEDLVKEVDNGAITDLRLYYKAHLVQL